MNKILNSKGCKTTVDYKNKKRIIINNKLKSLEDKFSNVKVIDRNHSLEINKNIYRIKDEKGTPLFFDDNHLSSAGSMIVGQSIMNQIEEDLSNSL